MLLGCKLRVCRFVSSCAVIVALSIPQIVMASFTSPIPTPPSSGYSTLEACEDAALLLDSYDFSGLTTLSNGTKVYTALDMVMHACVRLVNSYTIIEDVKMKARWEVFTHWDGRYQTMLERLEPISASIRTRIDCGEESYSPRYEDYSATLDESPMWRDNPSGAELSFAHILVNVRMTNWELKEQYKALIGLSVCDYPSYYEFKQIEAEVPYSQGGSTYISDAFTMIPSPVAD